MISYDGRDAMLALDISLFDDQQFYQLTEFKPANRGQKDA
jgi:hypothetical protein